MYCYEIYSKYIERVVIYRLINFWGGRNWKNENKKWCCILQYKRKNFLKIYYLYLRLIYRYGFVHIGRVGSVLLTLSVTVERFFAIVYPLKRIRRTRFLIYSSVIGAIAYNVPRFFEFQTNYIQINEGNETLEVSPMCHIS